MLPASTGIRAVTSNLIDVLQREPQRTLSGSFWWQNVIQSFKQGLPAAIAFFPFDRPSFVPQHLQRGTSLTLTLQTDFHMNSPGARQSVGPPAALLGGARVLGDSL